MEEQACPRCRTTKYRNPSLKLMVNVCGHTLCEACVDLLFLKGSGTCPQCYIPLRRNNFRLQLFEDSTVEKEIDIRRRILRDYNKREEDFDSLEEYNDYLEEVETIIYNLCNNIDVIDTNRKIDTYKRENREIIQRNRNRLGREEYELEEILELEQAAEEARQKEILEFEAEQKKKKKNVKEALLDELMFSGKDAAEIVSEFAAKNKQLEEEEKTIPAPKPPAEFSTGIKFGRGGEQMFLPVPKTDDGPLYVHQVPTIFLEGPPLVSIEDIQRRGFLKNIRSETPAESAGGFCSIMPCQRALQEAFQGLYYGL